MSDTTKAGELDTTDIYIILKDCLEHKEYGKSRISDEDYLEKKTKEIMDLLAQERTKLVDELISKLPEVKIKELVDPLNIDELVEHSMKQGNKLMVDQVTQLLKTYREGRGNLDEQ